MVVICLVEGVPKLPLMVVIVGTFIVDCINPSDCMDNFLTKFGMLTSTMNSPFIKLTLALGNLPPSTVLVVLSLYRLSKCFDNCPKWP